MQDKLKQKDIEIETLETKLKSVAEQLDKKKYEVD